MDFHVKVELTASPELIQTLLTLAAVFSGKSAAEAPAKISKENFDLAAYDQKVQTLMAKKEEPKTQEVAEEPVKEEPQAEEQDNGNFRVDYSEAELMEASFDFLMALLASHGVNPAKVEGKNTNKKLRTLVLEAQEAINAAANAAPGPEAKEETETVAEPEQVEENTQNATPAQLPDAVMLRSLMAPRIQNKATKEATLALIKGTGYSAVSELCEKGSDTEILSFYEELKAIRLPA